jgi:hypothetical protein
MQVPLFSDLKNDTRLRRNLLRVIGFLLLFFVLDLVLSVYLLKGINRFYGLKSDADVLMLGHSHLMLAVDKVMLEEESGLKVAKYTREGVNMADRRVMAQQYFSTCSAKPEIVILSIDPWLFSGDGLSQNSWLLFLPFLDDTDVNAYIKSSAPKKFDYIRYKFIRTSRFNAQLLNASVRGWLKNWSNLKIGVVDTVRYGSEQSLRDFRPITFSRELMDDFSYTLDFLAGENTRVILLNTPVWQPLINAQRPEYDRAMFLIDSLAQRHCPAAEIVDLVPEFSTRTKLFFDPIHMNPEGQKAVTEILAECLKLEVPKVR